VKNDTTYIFQLAEQLQQGKTILYPTDTIYGIGCDATNEAAVDKIFAIKNRPKEKSLIVLVDSVAMLQKYVAVNDQIIELINSFELPTTLIYQNPKGIAKNAINHDNTIAIRIVKHQFCQDVIQQLNKPIISTSANISGEKNPVYFDEISLDIKNKIDVLVPAQYDTSVYKFPSKLIKIKTDNTIEYLR